MGLWVLDLNGSRVTLSAKVPLQRVCLYLAMKRKTSAWPLCLQRCRPTLLLSYLAHDSQSLHRQVNHLLSLKTSSIEPLLVFNVKSI